MTAVLSTLNISLQSKIHAPYTVFNHLFFATFKAAIAQAWRLRNRLRRRRHLHGGPSDSTTRHPLVQRIPPIFLILQASPPRERLAASRFALSCLLNETPVEFVQKISQPPARKPPTQEETDTLKLKKSWEIALGPGKQLPMQLIMSYMSGNSLQVCLVQKWHYDREGQLMASRSFH